MIALPRTYWLVWWGSLVNRLGGFVVPLLTIYLVRVRHLDVDEAGGVAMGFGAGQVAASIVGGQLADRVGRRATLLISLFGGAVVMVALGQARSIAAIATLVVGVGFVGELYRPAVGALVADIVPADRRLAAFGYLYWAVNLGFAIASSIGGLVADRDFTILFYADAATTFAYGVIVAFTVPETRPATIADKTHADSPFRDRQYMIFMALVFANAFIIMLTGATLAVHMTAQGFEPSTYGFVLATNGVLVVILQPLMTRWSSGWDSSRALAGAVLLYGLGMCAHGLAPIAIAHVGAVVIWTLGETLDAPMRSVVVADMSPLSARGRYQGALVLAWGLAQVAAPKLGTWTWNHAGPPAVWNGALALSVIVAILFLVTAPARRRRLAASSR